MATHRNLRDPFDRDNDFVTVRPVKFNGHSYGPGQPFDKSQVTTRRLRQLYDGRFLRMVVGVQPVPSPRPPVQVSLGNMVEPPKKIKRVKLQEA